MKYVIVALWSIVFGEILGYLVSQLSEMTYNPVSIAIMAIVIGEIAVALIPAISQSANKK